MTWTQREAAIQTKRGKNGIYTAKISRNYPADKHQIRVASDYALSHQDNHSLVAKVMADQNGWSTVLESRELPDGSYAHVVVGEIRKTDEVVAVECLFDPGGELRDAVEAKARIVAALKHAREAQKP